MKILKSLRSATTGIYTGLSVVVERAPGLPLLLLVLMWALIAVDGRG